MTTNIEVQNASAPGTGGGLTPDAEGNIIITLGENPDTDQPGYFILQHPVTGYKLKLDIAAFIASDRTVEFPDNSGKFVYRINNIFTPDEAGNITLPLANTINPVYGDSSITAYFGKNVFLCYAYSGTLNIYLNSANNNVGEFIFKKSDGTGNSVIINAGSGGDGQEYINGSLTSVTLSSEGDILHIVSDNAGWHSI